MNVLNKKSAWKWVPSLYFLEAIPYVMVMTVSVIMYKRLGVSNTDLALYTGWLYLPWVIKPFWSPFVDLVKTKRWWIVCMQFLMGGGLAALAFCIPLPFFFQSSLAVLWIIAFSSATHDIAADGFYMLALSEGEQSFFVGIRSTFYRLAMIVGQGALVMFAGYWEKKTGNVPLAWSYTVSLLALLFFLLSLYHLFLLPHSEKDHQIAFRNPFVGFFDTFKSFFQKSEIVTMLAFLLLYRLGEAQLVKIASPFLLESRELGGLGMGTSEVGFAYGTVGVAALTLGGILGGVAVSRKGLGYWLWLMVLCMNLPNLGYVYLAYALPESLWVSNAIIAVEQFGYGFGFTAYMLYMIYVSQGIHQTAHYAICTGFMALGMMLPGMVSGWIQEQVGYQYFFLWVCLCTLPGFLLVRYLKIDRNFGRKAE